MNRRFDAELIAELIAEHLDSSLAACLHSLQVLPQVDSTNSYLLRQQAAPPGCFHVAIAEHQTDGRGQLGKVWESPPHTGICLSLAYTANAANRLQSALSLAVGTAIAQGLADLGVQRVAVKWPNDIIAMDGKLGGILIESRVSESGHQLIVVGIGLNVDLGGALDHLHPVSGVGRISDLMQCASTDITSTQLAATLINSVASCMLQFERDGICSFLESWPTFDWLFGREVCIESDNKRFTGIANGINTDGALLVQTEQNIIPVISGSVTLPVAHEVVA